MAAVSRLAATGLWGFGLWWLAAAVALLVRYLRHAALPYGPGWWAFTFPLGAYTLATLTLARAWDTAVLEWIGVALFLALLGFWAAVTTSTPCALWAPVRPGPDVQRGTDTVRRGRPRAGRSGVGTKVPARPAACGPCRRLAGGPMVWT